jgi:hypothetical protein
MIESKKISGLQLSKDLGLPQGYVRDRIRILETLGAETLRIKDERGLTKEQEKKLMS